MKKRKRINDDGFSILEAMVAIVILSIIFIPVANSFISSIKASKETKVMQEATSTAQLVMEEVKQKTFQELAKEYTVTEGDISTDAWTVLKLKKEFLRADNGCCDFDVNVEVSKTSTTLDTSGINDINAVDLKKIYSMDSPSSYTLNIGAVPDDALDRLSELSHFSRDTVKNGVNRTIRIGLETDSVTGNTRITSKIVYRYGTFEYEGEAQDTTLNAEVKNIYLYYVAGYDYEYDTLVFQNDEQLKGNFYVIGEGASDDVEHYSLLLQNCTYLNRFHVATTVPMAGSGLSYPISADTEFAPSGETRTRRYEIKVTVNKKQNGKEYSRMISTRGE